MKTPSWSRCLCSVQGIGSVALAYRFDLPLLEDAVTRVLLVAVRALDLRLLGELHGLRQARPGGDHIHPISD